jgi:hypothetical protein|tara:strand:+ start:16477 stop:16872 length:396 start_codon:yes stop_codon:yes gene_type:complete
MAIQTNEYVSSATIAAHPSIEPQTVQPKKFAAGTALLKVGTPVAFDTATDNWKVWDFDGTNGNDTISGIVFPEDIQLLAGGEVIGPVMLQGKIAYTSVTLPSPETEANMKTALRTGPRALGIIVSGLDQVV